MATGTNVVTYYVKVKDLASLTKEMFVLKAFKNGCK